VPTGAAISLALIQKIVGKALPAKQKANAASVVAGLTGYGPAAGLDQPHRVAQFLAQVLHESGAFTYDHELWGPTPAQKRYEGRKDLGNTVKGDGSRYRGRGPIQITGRANYRAFTAWARKLDPKAPNFEADPDAVNTDPWEGLGPIWYWDTRGLNRYADQGDIEMITKKINGGLNGYQDRLDWYARVALVLLGLAPNAIAAFQQRAGEKADGIAGPRTRATLHQALVALTAPVAQSNDVQAAPVVEEKKVEVKVPVAVNQPYVPPTIEKAVKKQTNGWGWSGIGLGGAGAALTAIAGWPWQTIALFAGLGVAGGIVALVIGPWIVGRVKTIRAAVEG
jgi:putative chitinase